jgi:hypothetical protein
MALEQTADGLIKTASTGSRLTSPASKDTSFCIQHRTQMVVAQDVDSSLFVKVNVQALLLITIGVIALFIVGFGMSFLGWLRRTYCWRKGFQFLGNAQSWLNSRMLSLTSGQSGSQVTLKSMVIFTAILLTVMLLMVMLMEMLLMGIVMVTPTKVLR